MKNFAYRPGQVLLALAILSVEVASMDVGGGSGKPMTPYRTEEEQTLANVKQMCERESQLRLVRSVKLAGTDATRTAYRIGFEFLNSDAKPEPNPARSLQGKDPSGKAIELSLANIESIKLLSTSRGSAKLLVVVFPDINPDELLAKHPSYKDLLQHYKREVTVDVATTRNDGRQLYLVGSSWAGEENLSVAIRLSDLSPELAMSVLDDFGFSSNPRGPWWAIASVIADADYPYRVHMKS